MAESIFDENKYTVEELIEFVSSSTYFTSFEKNYLVTQLKSEESDISDLKVVITAIKDHILKLPLLPRASDWFISNKTRLSEIIKERYDSETNYLSPNVFSDKLFGSNEDLKVTIDNFVEMYKGTENEEFMPILYKIFTLPRNLYIPIMNLLLLRLCTIEELYSISPLSDIEIGKFIKRKLKENFLLSDQLLDYSKIKYVRNLKYSENSNFFETAYLMHTRFKKKNLYPVDGLEVTFIDDASKGIDYKYCYKDENQLKEKYNEIVRDQYDDFDFENEPSDLGNSIVRKLKIFINDEETQLKSKLIDLAQKNLNTNENIFVSTDEYNELGELKDFFKCVNNCIFNPIFGNTYELKEERLNWSTSYKLVITNPNGFSRVKTYSQYINEMTNFYFPYKNSLPILNQIAYKFIEKKAYEITPELKEEMNNEINELLSESSNIIIHADTKLNKILFTKRFLLCTDYDQDIIDKFDKGVEILMNKIRLMRLLFMAIYSISSVSLKTRKG